MGSVGLAAGMSLLGWLLGISLALAAYRLNARRAEQPLPHDLRLLWVDPPLQAFQALTLAALALRFGPSIQLVAYGALSLVLTLVLFVDLRTRFVYVAVAYPGIAAGVVLSPIIQGGPFWEGVASATLGAIVFGALYALGRLLYRGAVPLAGGDVVIAALVGAAVGLPHLASALLLGVLFSGGFAFASAARQRSLHGYVAYGPGLCVGALVALLH